MRELEIYTVEMYHDIEKLRDFILTPSEARKIGINRSTLKKLKSRVKEGELV
jgi:hypothetical protein